MSRLTSTAALPRLEDEEGGDAPREQSKEDDARGHYPFVFRRVQKFRVGCGAQLLH
jgi:hypothetical protein